MTTAERAAAPLLPPMPRRDPDGPGQFGLADPDRTRRVIEAGGWSGAALEPIDFACRFPADQLERYFTWLGPVGLALRTAEDEDRARLIEVVRAAFEPFVHGDEVRFDAACWAVSARGT